MSYRAPGVTDADWFRQLQSDIRYLYKCCEKVSGFEVVAAAYTEYWDYGPAEGTLTERWYPPFGSCTLLEVFASVHPDFPVLADSTVEVLKNGAVIGTVTITVADQYGFADFTEVFSPTDYLQFALGDNPAGGGGMLVVQGMMEGTSRGSAGINFTHEPPPE